MMNAVWNLTACKTVSISPLWSHRITSKLYEAAREGGSFPFDRLGKGGCREASGCFH